MRKIFLMGLLLTTAMVQALSAQQPFRVKGTVTDGDGNPVVGATVVVVGTTIGVTSGANGAYSIACPKEGTLQFSFVGLETQTAKVQGRETIDVKLAASSIMMDEVVAIGYGTMRRKDLTGSVSSISGQTLSDIPVSDVAQALVGRLPGVNIRQSSGGVDPEISIRVRGGTSITQDNSPLYIIDGVPSDDGMAGVAAADIEMIDVLKDASATSIYGSRGANGVIIITTKSAKREGIQVSYQGSYGMSKNAKILDVLDAAGYVELEFERNLGVVERETVIRRFGEFQDIAANYPSGSSINWQEATFGKVAANQRHNISVSGGSKTSKFSLTYSREKDDGIMVNSGRSRDYLKLKYDFNSGKKFTLGATATYSDQLVYGSGSLQNHKSLLASMVRYRPTAGLQMSNSDFINAAEDPAVLEDSPDSPDTRNPVANAKNETNQKVTRLMTGSANASYEILKSLTYRGTINFTRRSYQNDQFFSAEHPKALRGTGPYGLIRQTFSDKLTYNNTLTYRKNITKAQTLDVMLGQEYINNMGYNYGFGGTAFPDSNFGLDDMGLASLGDIPSSSRDEDTQLSFFARANYSLHSKYYLTATIRADGSSKFGANNKWGYFPSVALAWRISDEKAIKNLHVFSDLKFRASYGATGNSRIGNYKSLSLFDSGRVAVNQGVETYYQSANIPNPDLKWESNITANIGLDFAFLKDRINGTVEWYNTETRDLLMDSQVPYSSGFTTVMRNIGSTRNRGWEVSLSSRNFVSKNFTWSTSFNIAFNKGKVLALADADYMELSSSWNSNNKFSDYLVRVGDPVGLIYGYVSDGIYTVDDFNYVGGKWEIKDGIPYINDLKASLKPGYPKYKNIDGSEDNLISSGDKTVIGNGTPKFFGGLTNTFNIWDFDLSIFLDFTYGNQIYNANRLAYSNMNANNQNTLSDPFNKRFRILDANGKSLMTDPEALAALNQGARGPSVEGSGKWELSKEFLEDGSFLRLNNITVGYSVPQKVLSKIHLRTLRVFASFQNLAVWTKYSGFDPEVGMSLSDRNKYPTLTPGLDYGSQPRMRTIVFGLNVSF